jgi:pimeloyl-ACP methyl ester carboxylesterase
MNTRRNAVAAAVLGAWMLAGTPAAIAADAADRGPVAGRTVVLVHGFFADGSCWDAVIALLQRAGVHVVAVQNPLESLAGDVAAANRVIDQQTQPVVLVGHSWGGAVVTAAGMNPKVTSLVYVAAFAPAAGQSVNDLLASYPPPPWLASVVADEGGFVTLSEAGYLKYFAPDLPRWQARTLAVSQGAAFAGDLVEPVAAVAWLAKPSWYVLTEIDQMILPELQRRMSADMRARVVPVRTGHDVMLSRPEAVADVILSAVFAD